MVAGGVTTTQTKSPDPGKGFDHDNRHLEWTNTPTQSFSEIEEHGFSRASTCRLLRISSFDVGPQLTIIATLVDSDVDTRSSNTRHKPSTLLFEKRSADDTRSGTESSSSGKLTISSESPRPQFRVAGQVDLISAAGSGAKILLNIAKESADAFGPLKSVLGGIYAVCNQYEVCFRTPVPRLICS